MSLRHKYYLYLGALHVLLAALAWIGLADERLWLFPVEIAILTSLAIGILLVRRLFGPLDLVRSGVEYIAAQEFTVRFREAGEPEVDRLIGVYNKMVDHLRDERTRLREQNYFLDRVLQVSPTGVVTLDLDGRIATLNPSAAKLLGMKPEAAVGVSLRDSDLPLANALAELGDGDARVIGVRGGRRIKCHRSTFLDRGFPRAFFLMDEVTEELRQSERAAYDKLIRTLSHEVNNSAGAVSSLLQSCQTYGDQWNEADRRDFDEAIEVAISRIDQLARFMASFADVIRLPPPRRQPVDVHQLLKDVERLMRSECDRRSIRWVGDNDSNRLPQIPMDRAQMEQVLVNVVKNAIEAIGEDGEITVRLGEADGTYFVEIQDTGPGIAAGVEENLFTPFFSTKEHGQGIGLTMSREILAAHSFECSLVGPPGGPTRFRIRF